MTIANLVKQTSTTTGTGNLTLASATGGFQTCYGAFGTASFFCFIAHTTSAEWEIGYYAMSDSTTLVRSSANIIASSNSGSLVNFSAGDKVIVNDLPATYQVSPIKQVRLCASTNVNISSAPSTIDGVTPSTGDRCLLPFQSTASQAGIYIYKGAATAMVRAPDADTDAELRNCLVIVSAGTNYAGSMWHNSNSSAITVGSTSITFLRYPQASTGMTYTAQGGLAIGSTGVSAGSYSYGGSYVIEPTINAQGQWTAVSPVPISISYSQIYDFATGVAAAGGGLTRGKTQALAENSGA